MILRSEQRAEVINQRTKDNDLQVSSEIQNRFYGGSVLIIIFSCWYLFTLIGWRSSPSSL